VAVVTEAGQGIGEAYSKGLAKAGASVVVAEINPVQGVVSLPKSRPREAVPHS
jgi:NAD(P)-dependent dehydrogenase (short-subunit alcohol dehydrogenase family)